MDRTKTKKEEICKHFLRGSCHYGLSGNKTYEGQKGCSYSHPKVCSTLLKYGYRGSKGCNGRNCNFAHPRFCSGSLDGQCTEINCKNGYHIKYPYKKPTTVAKTDEAASEGKKENVKVDENKDDKRNDKKEKK